MAEPDNKFIIEMLKKIQAGITEIRVQMTDMRNDGRDLKEAQISTREEIQALRRDVLRQERGFAALQIDMDQVKHRLDPHDAE
jgi:predicted  nucleic acid-binding Zn-ribbon protein